MRTFSLLILYSLGSLTFASYCGQSGIPYSFEVLSNGQPILGCARPSCFGWDANGKRAADSAQFYKIDGKSDGFLRKSNIPGPIIQNATWFRPQFSVCDRGYNWEECVGPNQWVGGIAPLAQVSSDSSFRVMCCTYSKLSESSDSGKAEIKIGQAVDGGEIKGDDGRDYAFEYISNIQRKFNKNGEVIYSVTMRRFPCLPEPATTETGVESGTVEELIKNVEKEQKAAIQFGAQTFQSSQQQQQQPLQSQSQSQQTFDGMKFDIPNNIPADEVQRQQQSHVAQEYPQPQQQGQQQFQTLQLATAEPQNSASGAGVGGVEIPTGYRRLNNGQLIPCAKPYPSEEDGKQAIAIPQAQQSQNAATAAVAYQQQQQQQQQSPVFGPQQQTQQTQYFQPSLFDLFGLFRQAYAAPTATLAPAVVGTQNFAQHPTMFSGAQSSPIQQNIPQPNQSYNPYWPLNAFYSYSQNPSATYGVQTAQASSPLSQSQHLIPTKTVPPRPQPLPVPTVEQVENAIPPAGRRMLYNVAKTLLNL